MTGRRPAWRACGTAERAEWNSRARRFAPQIDPFGEGNPAGVERGMMAGVRSIMSPVRPTGE